MDKNTRTISIGLSPRRIHNLDAIYYYWRGRKAQFDYKQ